MDRVTELLGVGGPSLLGYSDGGWDLAPVFVALVTLLVLRWALGLLMRWYVVLATFLLAPPAIAFSGWVGPPATLAFAAGTLLVARRIRAHKEPPASV